MNTALDKLEALAGRLVQQRLALAANKCETLEAQAACMVFDDKLGKYVIELANIRAILTADAPPERRDTMRFCLGEALVLLDFFGGHNCDVTVQEQAAGVVTGDEGEPMPRGKYAWCSDYPEEGSQWLGPHDIDTEEHNEGQSQLDRWRVFVDDFVGDAALKSLRQQFDTEEAARA